MDLNYDCRAFQNFFSPKKKITSATSQGSVPIYLVTEKSVAVSTFADGEDLSDWIGATCDEIVAEFPNREIIILDRENVEKSIQSAVDLPHFYDQMQYLRSHVKPQSINHGRTRNIELPENMHFLLRAIQSWWQKVLPSAFGIFIQVKDTENMIFLKFQRGKLSVFQVPDLSGMMAERRGYLSDVVKHLSSKYFLPIQGISVTQAEWNQWSEAQNPWAKIRLALKADKNHLVPFRWYVVALIWIRSYFGF